MTTINSITRRSSQNENLMTIFLVVYLLLHMQETQNDSVVFSFSHTGLSVSVDVSTLVCISIERFLAICHPFVLLRLRSISYASLWNTFILISIWVFGFVTALPNFHLYNLCWLPTLRRYKCEKRNLQSVDERLYMIGLDGNLNVRQQYDFFKVYFAIALYFIVPMSTMVILYTLIIRKLSQKTTVVMMRSMQSKKSGCCSMQLFDFAILDSTRCRTPSSRSPSPMIVYLNPFDRSQASASRNYSR